MWVGLRVFVFSVFRSSVLFSGVCSLRELREGYSFLFLFVACGLFDRMVEVDEPCIPIIEG